MAAATKRKKKRKPSRTMKGRVATRNIDWGGMPSGHTTRTTFPSDIPATPREQEWLKRARVVTPQGRSLLTSGFGGAVHPMTGTPVNQAATLANLQAAAGKNTSGILDFAASPVKSALTWFLRPESAVTHAGVGYGALFVEGESASKHFEQAGYNLAKFVEPLKWAPPVAPITGILKAKGVPVDIPSEKAPILLPSQTKAAQALTSPLPPGLEEAALFGLDIAGDPWSWTGIGTTTSLLRRATAKAVLGAVERRTIEELGTSGALEARAGRTIADVTELEKELQKLPGHFDLPIRVPFTRTPIPWRRTTETTTGRKAEWVNLNTLRLKNINQPKIVAETNMKERGLGFNIHVKLPAKWPTRKRPFGPLSPKPLPSMTHAERAVEDKRRKYAPVLGAQLESTRSQRFGDFLRGQQGAFGIYARKAAERFDDTFGPTGTIDVMRTAHKAEQLTAAGAALPRETHRAMQVATKSMNAASMYLRRNYVEPISKILSDHKIDRHYFYRLIDDYDNTIKEMHPSTLGPETAKAIEEARRLHYEMDKRITRYLARNGVLARSWQNYVPRFAKDYEANKFLTSNAVRGPSTAPGKAGFTYERRHRYLREVEDLWSETTGQGRSARRGGRKSPFESKIVETDYLTATERHIREVTQAVAGRELYRGLGVVAGGLKRPGRNYADEIQALEDELAALVSEKRRLTSRDPETLASARVEAKQTTQEKKAAEAELRGEDKAYHRAPHERNKKMDVFTRKLAQLSRSAATKGDKGSKHVKIRAEAEQIARDLVKMLEKGGGDASVVAQHAARAIKAADHGYSAATAQTTAIMDRLLGEYAQEALEGITTGATIPGWEKVLGPGMVMKMPSRPALVTEPSEWRSRMEASRTFGIPMPQQVQRGGPRASRRWREQRASTRSDGMDRRGKPSKQQKATWRAMFSPPKKPTMAEREAAAAGDVAQVERTAGVELQQAQQAMRRAILVGDRGGIQRALRRLRTAEDAQLKAQRRLGQAETLRQGTPGQIAHVEREIAKVRSQLRKAKAQQKRFDRAKQTRVDRPLHEAESMEEWNESIALLEEGDEVDRMIAAEAKRTGYLVPPDVKQAYVEWQNRISYAMNTPAELRGVARRSAAIQAMWKRYTLASTRRLIRDSLEDTFLLALEGVRDPRIMLYTWRMLGVPIHEAQVENKFVKGVRGVTGSLIRGHTFTTADGRTFTDHQMRQIMNYLGVSDVGRSSEAIVSGSPTYSGELAAMGAARGMNIRGVPSSLTPSRPSYGRLVTGLLSANQVRDNIPRIALFLHRLNEGDDIFTATRRVDQIFFDYADLNQQLMKLRRHVAPFITFTTKSIPLLGRLAVEHPSFYSGTARTWETLQRESGIDPSELIYQSSPTSPDVFNVPTPAWFAKALGGDEGEGMVFNPQSVTRLSSLNLLPAERGGSDMWSVPALMAGQLLGGPIVDTASGVWNFDVRRGAAYNEWRNTDPLTYNLMKQVQGVTGSSLVQPIDESYDENTGSERYRVKAPALGFMRAINPYIPGTLGAYAYPVIETAAQNARFRDFLRNSGIDVITSREQTGRARQRAFTEATGLNVVPEKRSIARHFWEQRTQ